MLVWQLGAFHKYTELPSFQLDRLPILAAEECLNPSIQLFADMLTIERLQRNDQYIVSEDTYDELQLTASSELERLIADREFIDDEAQEGIQRARTHPPQHFRRSMTNSIRTTKRRHRARHTGRTIRMNSAQVSSRTSVSEPDRGRGKSATVSHRKA